MSIRWNEAFEFFAEVEDDRDLKHDLLFSWNDGKVVKVERQFKHPLYKKIVRRHKKFKAHDENNECKVGDIVLIQESKPISKYKKWVLNKIIVRSK